VAAATGRPVDSVARLFAAGTFMSAQEALDHGLIDEICRPRGEIHRMPGPPIGFRPGR
jgi:ATP-dependent protease ClpP protease subunit